MITPSRSDSVPAVASSPGAKLPVTLDTKGRVRTSKAQRRAILTEFGCSGMSAAEFARRTGLKNSTFAFWVQLPGGARLEVHEASQIPLAAALVHALAKPC